MARAVATNFYTPKEVSFQGGRGVAVVAYSATTNCLKHLERMQRQFSVEPILALCARVRYAAF